MKHEADRLTLRVEDASRSLYKRKHRLTVCAAIAFAPDGAHYVREVAQRLKLPDNQVAPDFEALRAISALASVESPDRERWHQRLEHPLWQFTTALISTLAEDEAPGRGQELLAEYQEARLGLTVRVG